MPRHLRELLSHQEPCGYLGNYGEEVRCGMGWDVWGMKYTMMGLMHWYDATGDAEALAAASRLCDYLISELSTLMNRSLPTEIRA